MVESTSSLKRQRRRFSFYGALLVSVIYLLLQNASVSTSAVLISSSTDGTSKLPAQHHLQPTTITTSNRPIKDPGLQMLYHEKAVVNRSGVSKFYLSFWDRALQEALENSRTLSGGKEVPHQTWKDFPKVYVYNLSSTFRDVLIENTTSVDFAFGKQVSLSKEELHHYSMPSNMTLRDTSQYGLGVILEHRLRQRDSCYFTDDPSKADLFFLPILTRPKFSKQTIASCRKLATNQTATNQTATRLLFLEDVPNPDCRHFMVLSKGHYKGRPCKGWFWDPIPELHPAMRLAYSHVPAMMGKTTTFVQRAVGQEALDRQTRHPNLFSVPYPSSPHYHQSFHKVQFLSHHGHSRKHLMSFVGSWEHGDIDVRRVIRDQCQSYNDTAICQLIPPSRSTNSARDLLVKHGSIFCLEPVGDSPWRKSLSDSITFGCIPVLFSNDTDDVAPWFWGHWKKQGRVLLGGETNREDFLAGRIDLYQLLSSIPSQLLALMQETIDKYGRQFQYSLKEDHWDGIHTMLVNMKEYAEKQKRQGNCRK